MENQRLESLLNAAKVIGKLYFRSTKTEDRETLQFFLVTSAILFKGFSEFEDGLEGIKRELSYAHIEVNLDAETASKFRINSGGYTFTREDIADQFANTLYIMRRVEEMVDEKILPDKAPLEKDNTSSIITGINALRDYLSLEVNKPTSGLRTILGRVEAALRTNQTGR